MNEREEESGGAHGWVLGSRNSCEHMCFLPFVLCFVGPFFMPSHLNSTTAHKSVVLLLTGLYFSVRFFRLYIYRTFTLIYLPLHISIHHSTCAFASHLSINLHLIQSYSY